MTNLNGVRGKTPRRALKNKSALLREASEQLPHDQEAIIAATRRGTCQPAARPTARCIRLGSTKVASARVATDPAPIYRDRAHLSLTETPIAPGCPGVIG